MGAYECFLQIEFGSARLRDQNVTGQDWAKFSEFELIYLVNYQY